MQIAMNFTIDTCYKTSRILNLQTLTGSRGSKTNLISFDLTIDPKPGISWKREKSDRRKIQEVFHKKIENGEKGMTEKRKSKIEHFSPWNKF